MSLRIAGIGTAVPDHWIPQEAAAVVSSSFCYGEDRSRVLRALYRRAGVRKRHSVLLENGGDAPPVQSFYPPARGPDDRGPTTDQRMRRYEAEAPRLAVAATRRAIEASGVDAGRVTHSITVSCTGFHAPGVDTALIEEIGLPPTVERTHVGFMGCHGALNGIRVASSFARADPRARVLVCAIELCSLHFFYGWDSEKLVANALFADGAAALVGIPDGEPAGDGEDDGGGAAVGRNEHAAGDGDGGDGGGTDGRHRGRSDVWRATATGTTLIPESADAMTWRIGDHGFHMTLSPRVPDLIEEHVAAWLLRWLGSNDLDLDDIRSWAVHPGGPRILSAFGHAVGLDNGALEVSRQVLAEYGNMSSATVLFILERLRRRDAPRPCVALGFGPGMVVEAVLFR